MCTLAAIDPPLAWEALEALGVSVAFYPSAGHMAGNIANWDFLHDFRKRGPQAEVELKARTRGHPIAGFGLFDVVGFPKVRGMKERYLPAEDREDLSCEYASAPPRITVGTPTIAHTETQAARTEA